MRSWRLALILGLSCLPTMPGGHFLLPDRNVACPAFMAAGGVFGVRDDPSPCRVPPGEPHWFLARLTERTHPAGLCTR